MKLKIYEEILKDIKGATCFDKIKCLNSLKEKYPQFSEDTCISIYSQHMQRQVKKNFYKHHRAENVSKYYRIISRDMVEQSKNSFYSEVSRKYRFSSCSIISYYIGAILQR